MKKLLNNKLFWIFFGIVNSALLVTFFLLPILNWGGDIVEYHGITESLIKSGGIKLTQEVKDNLIHYLQPAYLEDPQYYIEGKDGERYPVHFIFYSVLALPVRLILKLFQLNELQTLRMTNMLIFAGTTAYLMKTFLPSLKGKFSLWILLYLSPLIWFIIWPGPDVFYLCMTLISIFFFFARRYESSLIAMAVASWHSQPLIIAFTGILLYYTFQMIEKQQRKDGTQIGILINRIPYLVGYAALASLPFVYNLLIFGALTPWTELKDGWTAINGFGPHNMHPRKFFEQLFDLNYGLFWYAPVIFVIGFFYAIREAVRRDKQMIYFLGLMLVTALFYQTNPAWHYGTSGFGPSRHAIYLLPFLIFAALAFLQTRGKHLFVLPAVIITQLAIMSFNGFLYPDLMNTLRHSPYARYVLTNAPALYTPTPEIFVDRTLENDMPYPQTAIFTANGECKKAYVLKHDRTDLIDKCGFIPDTYKNSFENPYERKANYPRKIKTIEATFWPDPGSCGDNFFPSEEKPYVCMKTLVDVMKHTGVQDPERFIKVQDLEGVWRMEQGKPVEITIPPGYLIHHYSFEGVYVTY